MAKRATPKPAGKAGSPKAPPDLLIVEPPPLTHEALVWPQLPPDAPPPANPEGYTPPDVVAPRKAAPKRKRWFKKG